MGRNVQEKSIWQVEKETAFDGNMDGKQKDTLKKRGFYQSKAWRRIRLLALQRDHYLCQECLKQKRIKTATEVHHIKPLEEYPELGLELDNLQSLCWDCHELTKHRSAATLPAGVRIIRITNESD